MPPNPQNLTPYPKGVSGNPKGRPPKGRAFADLLQLIEETPGAQRALSKVWLQQMLKGNLGYFKEYVERSDGKVPTPSETVELAPVDWSSINVDCDTVRPSTDTNRADKVSDCGDAQL